MNPPNFWADPTRGPSPCHLPGARRLRAVGWGSALLALVARFWLWVRRGPLNHEPSKFPAGPVLAALALAIPLALGFPAKADVPVQNTFNNLLARFSDGGTPIFPGTLPVQPRWCQTAGPPTSSGYATPGTLVYSSAWVSITPTARSAIDFSTAACLWKLANSTPAVQTVATNSIIPAMPYELRVAQRSDALLPCTITHSF
ncbi:MAG TPA: hypothetical protein VN829_08245 [Dongiaceae bacterium]|nr:hypothetical protein [Dongiaceae bacterium]